MNETQQVRVNNGRSSRIGSRTCKNRLLAMFLFSWKLIGEELHRVGSQREPIMQGWRSGESTRLPPMWPSFDFQLDPASYVG